MNDKNAFRYITDDPITLELTGCGSVGEVHERIKRTFGFPEYYGENWDAMWDCLRDVFFPAVPAASLWRAWAPWREICKNTAAPCGRSSRTCRRSIPGSRLCTDDCCPAFFS